MLYIVLLEFQKVSAAGVILGSFCAFKFLVDKGIIKEIADKLNRQLGSNKNRELEDKTK